MENNPTAPWVYDEQFLTIPQVIPCGLFIIQDAPDESEFQRW